LEGDMAVDPYQQFMDWMDDAIRSGIDDPTAMALATSDASGRPSVRMVLLKDARDDGFVFFSHYNSRKGADLLQNPKASIMFFWPGLDRQIRIEGKVKRTDNKESDDFFHSRPLESRLSSVISPQSQPIPNRAYLEGKFNNLMAENDKPLQRPENWGGYILIPGSYEFWQGRANRLNDRIKYELADGDWMISRLAP
jgi:pyridoxamine 5'-phosphate oxidase